MKHFRKLTLAALFCALAIACKFFLTFELSASTRISTTPIPVMLCGILLGPVLGGICGIVTDTIGFLIKPTGVYFPGFALSMALYGVIPGLFFLKNKDESLFKVIFSVSTAQVLCSMLLNTFFNYILYGTPLIVLFVQRLGISIISLAVYILSIYLVYRLLNKLFIKNNVLEIRP